ncbi:MAG TPA: phosphoribosylformylglycinamidine synthase [Cyclobacteriaceae bacterium]|nr:phosphoribosylformylglycinamidine synthase [Cyclobacteriaceae bacterium]
MIVFFRSATNTIFAVGAAQPLAKSDIDKLVWLFGGARPEPGPNVGGPFKGPRREMITPWSTNAVEIAQNMGISGLTRIEMFTPSTADEAFDPMLEERYPVLDQELYTISIAPQPIVEIDSIAAFNETEGLALSEEEIQYLEAVSRELGRKLTDSEVFGFSQVNSEHCRHKIFNGTFIIDGHEKDLTLFQLIRKTSSANPNKLVSAYRDNVAFIEGPVIEQFAPVRQDVPDLFTVRDINAVISLKAETHNFPTTVEPFNGAATGSGGEIRDRLAGGKGSLPLAGTAVYITSYPRLEGGRPWEKRIKPRKWLYHAPAEILIRASDGASDFGNKFGQPLICGSVLTFEHEDGSRTYGYDKVIMLAGGVGFARKEDSIKGKLAAGDRIVMLGGDNYRIGMGGGAVSSVATGEYANTIELNAVQRSNPEMQKRVMNAIRAMVEADDNPIITIHDHGAGGHLNCFSELLEETGGEIHLDKLPIGDPTLSEKEIISNESQERMGLGMREQDLERLRVVSERERAPFYVVGEATGDQRLIFSKSTSERKAVDILVRHLFGSTPTTILEDETVQASHRPVGYDPEKFAEYVEQVLQLEAVACKDWLTNKVDRSVTGKVAMQQTCGQIQLPLNNVGVMTLDYSGRNGVATAIGHAPQASLIDPAMGGKLAIAEALTNLVWAPLTHGLKGVSLSANWMWPAKNAGEDARLYTAVEAVSDFAIRLGINIPTGKDSLSMTQKYPDGQVVYSPGTVIISAVGEVSDVQKAVGPALRNEPGSHILYIDFSSGPTALGGSAFAQVVGQLGDQIPGVADEALFRAAFEAVQQLVRDEAILAGHDISAGGIITALLEMCFPTPGVGLEVTLPDAQEDLIRFLFSENPGVLIQVNEAEKVTAMMKELGLAVHNLARITGERVLAVAAHRLDIDSLRDTWFSTSHKLDRLQRPATHADLRSSNYHRQPLTYAFPQGFDGRLASLGIGQIRTTRSGITAAIIREKGVNGDRELAYALFLAGFDVRDVHMTDLVSGREDLSDVKLIAFPGGFANSDVLGSAKGWAGAFLYNDRARKALNDFYERPDTLSIGVCNGCQLVMELGLLYRGDEDHPKMHHNGSGKFESAFVNLTIPESNSVMLGGLAGSKLGCWIAHGEGRFQLGDESRYQVAARYTYAEYPGNPNDSDGAVAALCSHDGRHLAIMPHLERSLFPWNWGYYPVERRDEISPWILAFINAKSWIQAQS